MDAPIRHGQQHRQLVTHKCDKCLKEFYRRDKLVEHRVAYGDDDPCNLTSAFEESLKKIELKPRKDQKHDMSQFLRVKSKPILIHLSKELEMKKGSKWFISVKVRFLKPKVDGEDLFSEPHFRSLCTTTVNVHDVEKQIQEACSKIIDSLAIYRTEGSGWVLDEILHLDLNMAKYTPL
ncbi:Gastrula zinc finger [Paramuricea clavata]|uniref:Gastrula zinc finger n=1 Tax=Paramuricea clavata TaxID=317549 RepID=A0A6S7IEU0_PARCT|nr:Gastrula zinc finger [Paramuricea clavata]